MQAFFQNFPKKFHGQSGGPGKAAAKIVLKRASADPSLSKTSGDLAHLPYTPSQPSRTDSWRFTPGKASGNERSANCPWRSHRSHRGQTAGVSLRVKRVITSAPRIACGATTKKPPVCTGGFSVLAKTYFSGPSPAKYLRRRRA